MIWFPTPPSASHCWKAVWQVTTFWLHATLCLFYGVFLLNRSQIENFRSCTITPMAAAHQSPVSWCCWTVVSCEPFTLRNTHWQNPKLSAAPLPHTRLKCDRQKKWAAGSWGQRRDCDIKCNQTFHQSSSTAVRCPGWPGNHRSGVGREGALTVPSSSRVGLSLNVQIANYSSSFLLCLELKAAPYKFHPICIKSLSPESWLL